MLGDIPSVRQGILTGDRQIWTEQKRDAQLIVSLHCASAPLATRIAIVNNPFAYTFSNGAPILNEEGPYGQ